MMKKVLIAATLAVSIPSAHAADFIITETDDRIIVEYTGTPEEKPQQEKPAPGSRLQRPPAPAADQSSAEGAQNPEQDKQAVRDARRARKAEMRKSRGSTGAGDPETE